MLREQPDTKYRQTRGRQVERRVDTGRWEKEEVEDPTRRGRTRRSGVVARWTVEGAKPVWARELAGPAALSAAANQRAPSCPWTTVLSLCPRIASGTPDGAREGERR